MKVRRAKETDIPAMEALELEVYTEDIVYADEWAYHLARDEHEVWVLEDEKGLVGDLLLTARKGSTNLRVEGIAVTRRAQGKGYGKRLLQHAVRRAKARKKERLTLEVRRDNERAIEVYEAFGFQRVGTKPRYYQDGEDAVRMSLPLAGS